MNIFPCHYSFTSLFLCLHNTNFVTQPSRLISLLLWLDVWTVSHICDTYLYLSETHNFECYFQIAYSHSKYHWIRSFQIWKIKIILTIYWIFPCASSFLRKYFGLGNFQGRYHQWSTPTREKSNEALVGTVAVISITSQCPVQDNFTVK